MKVKDLIKKEANSLLEMDIMTVQDLHDLCEAYINKGKGQIPVIGAVMDKDDNPTGYRYIKCETKNTVEYNQFLYLDVVDGATDSEIYVLLEYKN